ncbi:MAG: acyltransferase [Solirubrobacteraceae bacterium]
MLHPQAIVLPPRRPALPSLTALRAIAAAGVFVAHSGFFVGRTDVTASLQDGGGAGGVTFFFVLSGTILAYNYFGEFSRQRFYRKRFARIYPVYLLAFVLGAFVIAAKDGGIAFLSPELITKNLLMVQGWFPHGEAVPGTAWTLSCEMLFYASFPLLIAGLRRIPDRSLALAGGLLLALALVSANLVHLATPGDGFFLSPLGRVPEFAMGLLLGLHLPRLIGEPASLLRRRSTPLLFACAVAVVAWPFAGNQWSPLRENVNLYVPICMVAIAAAAAADLEGPHWLSHRRFVVAGLWSYAFYSIHESIIRVIDGVFETHPSLPLGLAMGIVTFVGVGIAAGLIFRYWEEPWRERIGASRPKEVILTSQGAAP